MVMRVRQKKKLTEGIHNTSVTEGLGASSTNGLDLIVLLINSSLLFPIHTERPCVLSDSQCKLNKHLFQHDILLHLLQRQRYLLHYLNLQPSQKLNQHLYLLHHWRHPHFEKHL